MPELEPITREEKLLDGEDLTPITRKEKFIKRIYDKTQEIPEPVTREEMFLKKAGEGSGGDVTVEQLNVLENGTYSESGKAYSPVVVTVPQPTLTTLTATENRTYTAPAGTGYNEVNVNVPLPSNAYLLKELSNLPQPIASFSDGAEDLPLKSLTASIVPVQDLHGYDSPWVGGSGKNKLNTNIFSDTTYFTINSDGSVTQKIDDNRGESSITTLHMVAGEYIISRGASIGSMRVYANVGGNWTTFVNTSSKNATFTLSADCDLYIKISVSGTYPNTFYPMIRLASVQDATFAPYSNICPISGWTEEDITRTGKNLCPTLSVSDFSQGVPLGLSTAISIKVPNGTYTVSTNAPTGYIWAGKVLDSQQGYVRVYSGNPNTIIVDNGKIWIGILTTDKETALSYDIQIEQGNQATTYEPYAGTTTTIPFTDSQGNPVKVYGGSVDVVNGVLTVDRMENSIPSYWSINTESSMYWLLTHPINDVISVENTDTSIRVISDGFKGISANEMITKISTADNINSIALISSKRLFLKVTKADYPTLDDLYSMIRTNNLRLVYELATPTTFYTQPTSIKSLDGENNVFASTGDVEELKYFSKEV